MISIISTCKYKLSEEEYVRPLVEIAKKIDSVEVIHYRELFSEPRGEKIIISGTAVKDFEYLDYLGRFQWIKNTNKKVIGICAGSQIIAKVLDCELKKKELVGVYPVRFQDKEMKAYFLITRIPVLDERFEIIAKTVDDIPAIFKVKGKEIYGFLFHPEVLNEDLFTYFIKEQG